MNGMYAQVMSNPCNPMDCSPTTSSVHGIVQARILEWVVISSSMGSSWSQGLNPHLPCLLHWQADSLPLRYLGSPSISLSTTKRSWILPLNYETQPAVCTCEDSQNHFLVTWKQWSLLSELAISPFGQGALCHINHENSTCVTSSFRASCIASHFL